MKWCWKFKNVHEMQRQWGHEFVTGPPIWLTISRIYGKFGTDGSVQDVYKQQAEKVVHFFLFIFFLSLISIMPEQNFPHCWGGKSAKSYRRSQIYHRFLKLLVMVEAQLQIHVCTVISLDRHSQIYGST